MQHFFFLLTFNFHLLSILFYDNIFYIAILYNTLIKTYIHINILIKVAFVIIYVLDDIIPEKLFVKVINCFNFIASHLYLYAICKLYISDKNCDKTEKKLF